MAKAEDPGNDGSVWSAWPKHNPQAHTDGVLLDRRGLVTTSRGSSIDTAVIFEQICRTQLEISLSKELLHR